MKVRFQADNDLRPDQCELGVEPRSTCGDLLGVGLGMQPSLAPRFPFEVLHSVGDVNPGPIDICGLQALIKQLTSWPHKRLSLLVFAIARLFAHEKYRGMCRSLAKYHLGRALIEVASMALLSRLAQAGKITPRR